MKKLNNNGFTLVELLAVIVILLIIMGIAIPSITSALSRSEEKQIKAKKELILSEVEIRLSKKDGFYELLKEGSCYLTIDKLKELGWITKSMAEDNDGNPITIYVYYDNNPDVNEFKYINTDDDKIENFKLGKNPC